ncbi:hypothetical protein [Streptomyces sp. MAI_2237]
MTARERLLAEAAEVLVRQRERECALAQRSAALLTATAIVITVAVGLASDDRKGNLPIWLVIIYALTLALAALAIGGRELLDASGNVQWTVAWSGMGDDAAAQELMLRRAIAIRVNEDRLRLLQLIYWLHGIVNAAAVTASLTYLTTSI